MIVPFFLHPVLLTMGRLYRIDHVRPHSHTHTQKNLPHEINGARNLRSIRIQASWKEIDIVYQTQKIVIKAFLSCIKMPIMKRMNQV